MRTPQTRKFYENVQMNYLPTMNERITIEPGKRSGQPCLDYAAHREEHLRPIAV